MRVCLNCRRYYRSRQIECPYCGSIRTWRVSNAQLIICYTCGWRELVTPPLHESKLRGQEGDHRIEHVKAGIKPKTEIIPVFYPTSLIKDINRHRQCPICDGRSWLINEDCFFCPQCNLYYVPSQDARYHSLDDIVRQRTPTGPVDEVIRGFNVLLRENCGFKGLNPIQERALKEIIEKIENGHSKGIVALPTGTGKTILAACLIRWIIARLEEIRGARILFLAPRLVILEQVAGMPDMAGACITGFHRIFKDIPIAPHPLIERGNRYGKGEELLNLLESDWPYLCVVATTPQLLWNIYKDDEKWEKLLKNIGRVKVLIIDEVHHTYNGKKTREEIMKEIIDRVEYVIGLSATPTNEAVANVGSPLARCSIEEAMRLGVLVGGIKFYVYDTEVEKRSTEGPFDEWKVCIKRRAHEYAEKIIGIINNIKKLVGRDDVPKTAVACPNVKEANALYDILNEKLGKENIYIAHYESRKKRGRRPTEEILDFRDSKSGVLVSVNMIDIGFDDKDLEILVLARPIRNPISYVQLVGRVLRTPSKKTRAWNIKSKLGYCVVVDLTKSLYRLPGVKNPQGFFELSRRIMEGLERAVSFEEDLKGDKRKKEEIREVDANVYVTHITTRLIRPSSLSPKISIKKRILCPNCCEYVYPVYESGEKVCPRCGLVFSPRPRYRVSHPYGRA